MPSWNIHTAQVERLLADRDARDLGIADSNVFLFGNYVPDIYLGFMVPDITYRIDYCLTHRAKMNLIPVPDADAFWDDYIYRRRSKTPSGLSLALGAWAHLVADRFYNGRFRTYWTQHDMPEGDKLRTSKQADFELFGRSLGVSSMVQATPELFEAAQGFRAYSVLHDDVVRAIDVANAIVCGEVSPMPCEEYQLLSKGWMIETFNACNERLVTWLATWLELEESGQRASSANVRAAAGLPTATPDDPNWTRARKAK